MQDMKKNKIKHLKKNWLQIRTHPIEKSGDFSKKSGQI